MSTSDSVPDLRRAPAVLRLAQFGIGHGGGDHGIGVHAVFVHNRRR